MAKTASRPCILKTEHHGQSRPADEACLRTIMRRRHCKDGNVAVMPAAGRVEAELDPSSKRRMGGGGRSGPSLAMKEWMDGRPLPTIQGCYLYVPLP